MARGADDALQVGGVAPGFLRGASCGVHDPLDDHGIRQLDDDAVGDAARDRECLRAVAGDPHRDVRKVVADPLQLELLLVPVHGPAVHQVLDHLAAPLELRHADGLEPDDAA